MSAPTLLSLFSGGGLADRGYRDAGFRSVGAVEYDPDIAEWFVRNHGDHCHIASVADVDYRPYYGVTLLHMSPVCTRASVANQDASESGEDLMMADACCRAVREARPSFVVLENVGPYARFESFRRIVACLRAEGYDLTFSVINSADMGVPQTRKRLILRASRVGRVPALPQTHCEGGESGGLFGSEAALLPWVGWYAAVEDLIPTLPESRFADWQLRRLPEWLDESVLAHPNADNDWFVTRKAEEPSFTAGTFQGGVPRAFLVESKNANQQYGDGLRYPHEPATTVITDHKPSHMPKALLIEEPSFTLRAGENGGGYPRAWLEQGTVRAMTPRALARFQSVPDDYLLPEKAALATRIIGNGVPSLLCRRIGEAFLRAGGAP